MRKGEEGRGWGGGEEGYQRLVCPRPISVTLFITAPPCGQAAVLFLRFSQFSLYLVGNMRDFVLSITQCVALCACNKNKRFVLH
jgi:hypothetical protein